MHSLNHIIDSYSYDGENPMLYVFTETVSVTDFLFSTAKIRKT
jgi:hypothetical protein